MKRAAIYARFSTDLQQARSIADQVELCRGYAAKQGFDVVKTFADRALSGGSLHGRDGIGDLLSSAKRREFEIVIVESLDRLSRDMEDLASVHKRLTYADVKIITVQEGQASTIMVGLRGLTGQMFREDNAHKVRRGLAGRVRDGLSAGGAAYGYRPHPANKGKLVIAEDEAEVIRRIFAEFADGRSPRDIAHRLNRDGIAPPRGSKWNASTINGSRQRGSGIIRNALYNGRIVWNKVRMIKDPDTGKRISRANPQTDWHDKDVPELRIVALALFERAIARKRQAEGTRPYHQRRPRRLLSGLLRCGSCGSGMSTNGKDSTGRVRIRCSAATESGSCPDPKTFYLEKIEELVLETISTELRHPEVIREYLRTYHEERKRLAASTAAKRAPLERKSGELKREIDRLVDAIGKGFLAPELAGPRITEATVERDRIDAELGRIAPLENVVALHPNALARYEEQLRNLSEAFEAGMNSGDTTGADAMRDLIDRVTVFRTDDRAGSLRIEIKGRLNALLNEDPHRRGLCGVMVAGEGLEPPTRGL